MTKFCQRLCQHAEDEAERLQNNPDDVPDGFDDKPRPLDVVIPFVSKQTGVEKCLVSEYIHRCNHGQEWREYTRHDGILRPELSNVAGAMAEFGESSAMDELLDLLRTEYPTEAAEIGVGDFVRIATNSPGAVAVMNEVHFHLPPLGGDAANTGGKTDSDSERRPDATLGNTGQPAIEASGTAIGEPVSECSHSDDFSSMVYAGKRYSFTKMQANVVRLLWEQDGHELMEETIGEKVESEATPFSLRKLFRKRVGGVNQKHPAMDTVIVVAGKGRYKIPR